jgi:hypothetical protein
MAERLRELVAGFAICDSMEASKALAMTDRNQSCPVCDHQGAVRYPREHAPLCEDVDCPSCGKIRLSDTAALMLSYEKAKGRNMAAISQKLRDQPREDGERLFICSDLLKELRVVPPSEMLS